MDELSTELSTSTTQRTIPFTIASNGKTNITVPMSDTYASTISMYINNQLKDVVFMADGVWSYGAGPSTTVNSFKVKNDAVKTYLSDELPVFRNVELSGNSADYVSIFKLLKGGGIAEDLSAYKTLQFTASGGYNLRVTLVKNSISKWTDQYSVLIPLDNVTKDYFVSLSSFTSSLLKDKINANDVTTVVFSIEVGNGQNSVLNTTLSNISFTKLEATYLNNLNSKEIQLYPNPAPAKNFNCIFYSNVDVQQLTLRVTDAMGRTIATQQVNAVKGLNILPVTVNSNINGVHFITLDGTGVKYNSKKMLLTSQ